MIALSMLLSSSKFLNMPIPEPALANRPAYGLAEVPKRDTIRLPIQAFSASKRPVATVSTVTSKSSQ